MQAFGEGLAGCALQAEYADFLDVGRLQVMCFDFFGVDIFAVAQNDDVFFPAGNEEVTVGIAVAQVAAA